MLKAKGWSESLLRCGYSVTSSSYYRISSVPSSSRAAIMPTQRSHYATTALVGHSANYRRIFDNMFSTISFSTRIQSSVNGRCRSVRCQVYYCSVNLWMYKILHILTLEMWAWFKKMFFKHVFVLKERTKKFLQHDMLETCYYNKLISPVAEGVPVCKKCARSFSSLSWTGPCGITEKWG